MPASQHQGSKTCAQVMLLAGPGSVMEGNLLRSNPSLGGMTYEELQNLQQAMTSSPAYPQVPAHPPERSHHWQQDRSTSNFPLEN